MTLEEEIKKPVAWLKKVDELLEETDCITGISAGVQLSSSGIFIASTM